MYLKHRDRERSWSCSVAPRTCRLEAEKPGLKPGAPVWDAGIPSNDLSDAPSPEEICGLRMPQFHPPA